jgi:hypothetical protein
MENTNEHKPCRAEMIAAGAQAIPKSCPRHGLSKCTDVAAPAPAASAASASSASTWKVDMNHIYYRTADADKPAAICDRNGEVVLNQCKVCGQAEAELKPTCPGPAVSEVAELQKQLAAAQRTAGAPSAAAATIDRKTLHDLALRVQKDGRALDDLAKWVVAAIDCDVEKERAKADAAIAAAREEGALAREAHLMQSHEPLMDAASAKERIARAEATIADLRARLASAGAGGDAVDLLPPMGIRNDREMLNYLMQAFDSEMSVCNRCGDEHSTSTCDSAHFLRDYLKAAAQRTAADSADNMQRAADITATWPEWKRGYPLTKYSAAAAAPGADAGLLQALRDITDPIGAMQREVPEGYKLDGHAALAAADKPQWYKNRAERALAAYAAQPVAEAAAQAVPQELANEIAKLTAWKHCMSYNDSYFGEPAGDLKRITYQLDRLVGHPATQPVAEAAAQADDSALRTAQELALAIWRDAYSKDVPRFEVLETMHGVLSQIDNMVSGMVRAAPAAQPAPIDGNSIVLDIGPTEAAAQPGALTDDERALFGQFDREDLESVADGLEAGYEKSVDVGGSPLDGPNLVESSTAFAARFIRAALRQPQETVPVGGSFEEGYKALLFAVKIIAGGKTDNPQKYAQLVLDHDISAPTSKADAEDAARFRLLCERYETSLLVTFFGNGCVNRTIAEVIDAIDAARALAAKGGA